MSEKQKFESEAHGHNHEQPVAETAEKHPTHESKPNHGHEQSAAESHEKLQELRHEVHREARASSEVKPAHQAEKTSHHGPIKRELQDMMFTRTLTSIRKQLPAGQRTLSKIVHNKTVDSISNVGEKTVARPYGILGGGLAALIGSTYTFYAAKHYGFRYNFLLFFLLFIAGYIVATVLEAIFKVFRRAK